MEKSTQSVIYEMDIWLNCPFCKERVNFRIVYREGEWHIVSTYGPSGDLAIHHEGEEKE